MVVEERVGMLEGGGCLESDFAVFGRCSPAVFMRFSRDNNEGHASRTSRNCERGCGRRPFAARGEASSKKSDRGETIR